MIINSMGDVKDEGGESVRVVVRLRPEEQNISTAAAVVSKDGQGLAGSCILSVGAKKLTIVDPGQAGDVDSGDGRGGKHGSTGSGNKEGGGKQAHDFEFDRVFGPAATQLDLFETVKPLVHATVDGESCPVRSEKGSCLRRGYGPFIGL